jgi:Spy/CpxP family protein refolding chaperone
MVVAGLCGSLATFQAVSAQPATAPATGPAAAARAGREGADGPIAQRIETLMQRLDLTADQKQKAQAMIEQWQQDHQAFVQAHGAQLKQAMDNLREAQKAVEDLRKQNPDTGAMEKFKALLTPQQQKQLDQIQARQEQFHREHGLPGLADKLKLTADQRQSLRQIAESSREAIRQFRDENHAQFSLATKDLREAIAGGDQQNIEAARKALRELFENSPVVKQIEQQIKQVLTPEQLETWQKLGADRLSFLGLPGGPEGPGGAVGPGGPGGPGGGGRRGPGARGGPPQPPQD